jgi:protein-S-isoprenylcysteine O-methyltransferase Ste14
LGLLVFLLLQSPHDDASILRWRFFHFGPAISWIGAWFTVIGITLAIWARLRLGRDWGIHQKENPMLVTSGPYAYIRHPLYAGAMLALFGSALTGSIVAVALFIISIIFCRRRIDQEERAMLRFFPEQYPSYRVRTKRILPFVW